MVVVSVEKAEESYLGFVILAYLVRVSVLLTNKHISKDQEVTCLRAIMLVSIYRVESTTVPV